jgi:hypothetical protein
MSVELKTGASRFTILEWARKSPRTEAEAILSGRSASKAWLASIQEGLIEIVGPERKIVVTPDGIDYAAELIVRS